MEAIRTYTYEPGQHPWDLVALHREGLFHELWVFLKDGHEYNCGTWSDIATAENNLRELMSGEWNLNDATGVDYDIHPLGVEDIKEAKICSFKRIRSKVCAHY